MDIEARPTYWPLVAAIGAVLLGVAWLLLGLVPTWGVLLLGAALLIPAAFVILVAYCIWKLIEGLVLHRDQP